MPLREQSSAKTARKAQDSREFYHRRSFPRRLPTTTRVRLLSPVSKGAPLLLESRRRRISSHQQFLGELPPRTAPIFKSLPHTLPSAASPPAAETGLGHATLLRKELLPTHPPTHKGRQEEADNGIDEEIGKDTEGWEVTRELLKDAKRKAEAAVSVPISTLYPSTLRRYLSHALDGMQWILDHLSREPGDNPFLCGNFAPVPEAPAVKKGLQVTGALPEYLNGQFLRAGPNPRQAPTSGHHWFDGDGMLHAVGFKCGAATYTNHQVRTSRLRQEEEAGRAILFKLGSCKGVLGLLYVFIKVTRERSGIVDIKEGFGAANTAVVFHNGHLHALHEIDAPYTVRVLDDGSVETVGRLTYDGALDHPFTAHPKLDPVTGELYIFGNCMYAQPNLTYRVVSRSGVLGPKVPITFPEPVMMHDFAITEGHAVFLDLPLVFDPMGMVIHGEMPFVWKDRPARFGILPRDDTSDANMRWFVRPPCMILHTACAWEEDGEVHLVACRYDKMNLSRLDTMKHPAFLSEFIFNLKTGTSSERILSKIRCDFPKINENRLGRRSRYVYAAVNDGMVDSVGIVKFDLTRQPRVIDHEISATAAYAREEVEAGGCAVGFFEFGPQRLGGDLVFVPRPGADPILAEDDGCILVMVFDALTQRSEVLVIDAKTMSPTPLAVVHLGCRVPHGFHASYVSETQLQHQK